MKTTRPRSRAQVRPAAEQKLAEHKRVIKSITKNLGRRIAKDMIEVGRRLHESRKLLKDERRWLAWLEDFHWSRRTVEHLIAIYEGRDKVVNWL